MLGSQKGFALWLMMLCLCLSLYVSQYLFESLSELMRNVHEWKMYQLERQQLKKVMTELFMSEPKAGIHHAQTFDYSWEYLGEYSCVLSCKPKCYGTRHWLLSAHFNRMRVIWRVALQHQGLICHEALSISILNPVLYEEIDFETQ
jgi:hypothetical protein